MPKIAVVPSFPWRPAARQSPHAGASQFPGQPSSQASHKNNQNRAAYTCRANGLFFSARFAAPANPCPFRTHVTAAYRRRSIGGPRAGPPGVLRGGRPPDGDPKSMISAIRLAPSTSATQHIARISIAVNHGPVWCAFAARPRQMRFATAAGVLSGSSGPQAMLLVRPVSRSVSVAPVPTHSMIGDSRERTRLAWCRRRNTFAIAG